MRLGLGSGPGSCPSGVFWVGSGALYEAYSGRMVAIFEGFDVGKGLRPEKDRIRQLSRKIFWFRDPETGEVMTEYKGMPVRPIVYDAQVIDFHRNNSGGGGGGDGGGKGGRTEHGFITYSVEASLRKLNGLLPKMEITSRMAGQNQMTINVPVFLDVPIPNVNGGGERYRAWEFYDYTVDPTFPPDRPPTAVWCRQGTVPPFSDHMEACVLRFAGHRVDRYEDLPERMKIEVEKSYPKFTGPPLDEEEAMRLAQGLKR
jgi:hypothetical protein